MASELKAKGNQLYKEGDYTGAEDYYSQAYEPIQQHPP
jgi:STIP1 family protein 1